MEKAEKVKRESGIRVEKPVGNEVASKKRYFNFRVTGPNEFPSAGFRIQLPS